MLLKITIFYRRRNHNCLEYVFSENVMTNLGIDLNSNSTIIINRLLGTVISESLVIMEVLPSLPMHPYRKIKTRLAIFKPNEL